MNGDEDIKCDCPPLPVVTRGLDEFKWVSEFVEIKEGSIPWKDCGEGTNRCAFWENYQADGPLPTVKILNCSQEGTAVDPDGSFVTGLGVGEHIIVGATIRPCDSGIVELPE